MRQQLSGKTALVTGGSRGIGAAIVRELSLHGANVVINCLNHKEDASKLRFELTEKGYQTEVIQADVTDRDQISLMVVKSLERFGQIDILVNNAGITRDRTLKRMSIEEWDGVIQTNLNGVFHCTHLVAPHMIERQNGSIVNISSIIGATGGMGQSNYSAAKAGIVGFTKSCALELARYGITVNAICPGFVDTDMLKAVPAEAANDILKRIPLGRFAQPEEIARFVRFLVTEGGYITGQAIHVNGGLYLH